MKKAVNSVVFLMIILITLSLSACSPVDKSYGVDSSEPAASESSVKKVSDDVSRPAIMSDDRVMPQFVDISLFDEENYSKIYLGKKFKFNVSFAGDEFSVPTTLTAIEKNGWKLLENSQYDEDSLVYACDSVDAVFENENGVKINATFFNSSNSSIKLKKCNIVKFKIENDFYTNADSYDEFNVNGVNNKMAITDIIDTLGTPSHFYGIS